ncbi:MAG: VTT domain-containing protein [Candidatus Levybacteria bacterium]|nr:VTT domain-containing protein [Candidatus Levybacteria bacterium]
MNYPQGGYKYTGIIILGILYILFLFLLRYFLGDPSEIFEKIKHFYVSYGYPMIFVGAILEATFPVGLYVPGSTVILFGSALSRSGGLQFPIVYILAVTGLLLGYTLNYFVGRYGIYRVVSRFGLEMGIEEAKKRLKKHGKKAILIGYFHPGSASLLSTAAGVVHLTLSEFFLLSLIGQSLWALLWGGLAYFFGMIIIELLLKYFGYIAMFLIVIWVFRKL